jgi:hypothetical protein
MRDVLPNGVSLLLDGLPPRLAQQAAETLAASPASRSSRVSRISDLVPDGGSARRGGRLRRLARVLAALTLARLASFYDAPLRFRS